MTTEPVVMEKRVAPPEAELDLMVPADLDYCRGHFANTPVVPGIVQVKWAIDAARRHLGASGDVIGVEALKFRRVLVPGSVAKLTLTWVAHSHKLSFAYRSDDSGFSSGRLLFRPAP